MSQRKAASSKAKATSKRDESMDLEEEEEEEQVVAAASPKPKSRKSTAAAGSSSPAPKRVAKKKGGKAKPAEDEGEDEEGEADEGEQAVKKTPASSKKKATTTTAKKATTKKSKEATTSDGEEEDEDKDEDEEEASKKEKEEPQGGKKRKRQDKATPKGKSKAAAAKDDDEDEMEEEEEEAAPKSTPKGKSKSKSKATPKGKAKATPRSSRKSRGKATEDEEESDSDAADDGKTKKGSSLRSRGKSRSLRPSLYEEFQALNEGTTKLSKLRTRRGAATRTIKPEEEVPDSTLTFVNDIKPKYGANEFVAVNPETDEEEFYLAQLREDVFAKVQSVVHVLWLEPVDEDDKTVWEFEEFDSIPCGSIICRVSLKDGGEENDTMLLSEAERQRILERKALDSEEEEAADKLEEEESASQKKNDGDAEAEAAEEDEEDGDEDEDGKKKKKKAPKKKGKPVLKKALSKPQIVKEEEEEDKLLARLEKIEDPTFAPGKATKVAHRGARVQAAKRSTAKRIGAGAGRASGGRSRSASSSSKPRTRKRKTAEDDEDEDDDGEGTKRPAKRARTTRRRGKRVGELDKSVKKVTTDPTFDDAANELRSSCCTLCSSKEAIRAVLTNNLPLLKKVIADSDVVHSLFVNRSVDVSLTCLEYAAKTNNIDALKILVDAINNSGTLKRAKPTQVSLKTMSSGDYNFHTFGHAVRKVSASRGGKEGNNAFASDMGQYSNSGHELETLMPILMQDSDVKRETIDWLLANLPNLENSLSGQIYQAVYVGNRKLAGSLIEALESKGGWGFNFLHKQALLLDGKSFDQYKIQSVGKKPYGNNTMTPFHCAAINPNVKYLKELLSAKSEDRLPDSIKRQPIHYAAACSGPDPLKFLLERGISHTEVDMNSTTPLMIAAQSGRLDNIKLLLDWDKKQREKQEEEKEKEKGSDADEDGGDEEEEEEAPRKKPKAKAIAYIDSKAKGTHYTALHFAVMHNQVEAVKLLIERGANFEAPDATKMTPLHHATVHGFLDVIKVLVEDAQCNIEGADKLKRTSVIHAVRNGQLLALGYLLRMSADASCADSSNNTAAHYAAAFGWLECLKLLVSRGADPNAPNDWKTTPLGIAMQKGHMAIADYLLDQSSVDVNIRDDDGKTLVAQMMEVVTDSTLKQLKYLLEKKDADVTTADAQGFTPLHHLAKNYDPNRDTGNNNNSNNNDEDEDEEDDEDEDEDEDAMEEEEEDEEATPKKRKSKAAVKATESGNANGEQKAAPAKKQNWSVAIAKVLIKKGADVNAVTADKETPFLFAMQHYNEELIALLLQHGAQATSAFDKNTGQNILHQLTPHLMKTNVLPLLELIAESSAEQFKVMANEVDNEGFTPFLRFIQHYSTWVPSNLSHLRGGARTKQTARRSTGGKAPRKAAFNFRQHHHQQHHHHGYHHQGSDANMSPEERKRLEQVAREKFSQFLERFIELGGVNPALPVQKTKEWKDWVEKQKKDKAAAAAAGGGGQTEKSLLDEAAAELADAAEDPMEQEPPKQKGKKSSKKASSSFMDEEDEDEDEDEDDDDEDESDEEEDEDDDDEDDDKAKTVSNKAPPPYSAGVGLRTALHFLVGQDDTNLFKLLLDKYKLDINAQDFDGQDTPLLLAITGRRVQMFHTLLAHKSTINVNLPNRFGAAPLHQAVAQLNLDFLKALLAMKPNIDVRDKNERTPLHYALQRKNMDMVQALVSAGADVNAIDDNGRNGLHYAVNAADPGADASFEMEDYLLSQGAEVNLRDKHGRVPMHYAFIKIGHSVENQTSSIDPIETISSLCALKELEVDPADEHGFTPLHYAAQRGATTCSLLLLNRKADIERENRDGNTPLAVAIKSGHGDYAIMLLQKNANVRHPITYVSREWRQKEGTTDPKDKEEVETGRYSRSMFYVAVVNGWQGVSYMMLDAGLDKLTALTDAINTGKFQLVVTLLSKTKEDKVVQGVDAKGRTLFHHLANYAQGNLDVKWAQTLAEKLLSRKVSMVALDKHGRLPLHYAAKRGYFDLVFFFVNLKVDRGLVDKKGKSPLVYATQGQVTHQNLRIACTLMAGVKKADANILYPDPVYAAAKKAFEAKKARKASKTSVDDKDKIKAAQAVLDKIAEKTRPIIHAAKDNIPAFVTALLSGSGDVNAQDSLGKTALMYAVCNNDIDMVQHLFTGQEPTKMPAVVEAQPVVSPFGHFGMPMQPVFGLGLPTATQKKSTSDAKGKAAKKSNAVEIEAIPVVNKTKLDPNVQDANGKTALHYVVNPLDFGSYENVQMLLTLAKAGADVNVKDKQGHPPLYYAMQQRDGVMAKALQKLGAKLDKKESQLARQESFLDADKWTNDYGIPAVDWEHDAAELLANPPPPTEEEKKKAEKEKKEAHPVDREFDLWETSEVHAADTEDGGKDIYDVTLTKVDVHHGLYGINNFYRMQVIHNKVKDLYFLWNKWGRIGDTGQYQRTPFPSAAAACEEFRKIFRSKTGNAWEERADFDKKPKKYHLVKVDTEREQNIANLLKPFDIELEDDLDTAPTATATKKTEPSKYPASKLPLALQHAIKALTDSTMLTQAMKTEGIDTDAMPLGRLTKEDIEAAKQIVCDIRKIYLKIHPKEDTTTATEEKDEDEEDEEKDADEDEEGGSDEDEERPKKKKKTDTDDQDKGKEKEKEKPKPLTLDEAREQYEKIAELSNRFYELIPHSDYTVESIPPLDNEELLNQKFMMLSNLAEIQTASKILLGAHYRAKEINPLDYCYSAMNIRLHDIAKETEEYKTLMKYIKNTEQHCLNGKYITNIYTLQRRAEPERFKKWEELNNHQLLFHGSPLSNFTGILSQGLRIAPPEAPVSGYAFGKGIYFADMFQKSFNYCRMGNDYSYRHQQGKKQKQTGFLLLCEVALGEMNSIKEAAYMEKAPEGCHSTKGIGQRGPDFSKSIVLPNGVGIPVGPVITYPTDPADSHHHHYNYYRLQHNEYIVYDASQVRTRYLIQVSDQDPRKKHRK